MSEEVLFKLTPLVEKMIGNQSILDIIDSLKARIVECDEPFIGASVPKHRLEERFPSGIKSAWVFVIRPYTRIPLHHHPNSVQHTVVIEGSGKVKIDDRLFEVRRFNPKAPLPIWYVIGKNSSHQFVTEDSPVVVISFHTCRAKELIEVETESGRSRFYE